MSATTADGRTDWKAKALSYQKKAEKFVEENAETIRDVLDTVEVVGCAGVMGFVHGRLGGIPKRFGIPLDGALAFVAKLFAFTGWLGTKPLRRDLNMAGNGFGSYWAGTMGLDLGQRALRAAKKPDGTAEALGRPLTEDEAKAKNLDIRTNQVIAGEGRRSLMGQRMRVDAQARAAREYALL